MRLFVAVWPPPAVVETVAALASALRAGAGPIADHLRWTAPEQWHVTLRFLGRADLDAAVAAFTSVEPPAGVEATLGPATGRFGRRVLQVPVAGLEGLARAVVMATAGVGEPPEDRPFAGHLTLARARPRGGVDLSALASAAVVARWPVEEVTLVSSRTGPAGAGYEVVAARPVR